MPKTILVVDDDPQFVKRLCGLLSENGGYRTLGATDAESAVTQLERLRSGIDLAIIDLVLPCLSGPELIGAIQRRKSELRTKVLATTGVLKQVFLDTALTLGADAAIRKPGNDSEWLGIVRDLLGEDNTAAAHN